MITCRTEAQNEVQCTYKQYISLVLKRPCSRTIVDHFVYPII